MSLDATWTPFGLLILHNVEAGILRDPSATHALIADSVTVTSAVSTTATSE
jgi:hypothetical protein